MSPQQGSLKKKQGALKGGKNSFMWHRREVDHRKL